MWLIANPLAGGGRGLRVRWRPAGREARVPWRANGPGLAVRRGVTRLGGDSDGGDSDGGGGSFGIWSAKHAGGE